MREFLIIGLVLIVILGIAFTSGLLRVETETIVLCTDEGKERLKDVPLCTSELREKYGIGR